MLRGRVVRGDEPVPGFQVGLKAQGRGPGDPWPSYQYTRAYTDAEGRFTLRWRRLATPLVITLHPHWVQWDEFGFVGPMSEEEALAREHVLTLAPAVHVPARLHGTVRGASYLYYVSLVEGEDVVSTTINGVPIPGDADGEMRTVMRLPAGRRIRVAIGHVAEGAAYPNDSPPVELDTAHPPALLEFELSAPVLHVRGRVPGVDPAGLGVALLAASSRESSRRANVTLLGPDGSFELLAPRGEYELCLIGLASEPWKASLQARRTILLEHDLEGLQLVPEAPAPDPVR